MKRPLKRKSWIARGTKPLPSVNVAQREKRRIRQASKHRAYLRSETRKIVDARSAGQCEAWLVAASDDVAVRFVLAGHPIAVDMERLYSGDRLYTMRCLNRSRTHHHLSYTRYGGNELPQDVIKVCDRCHALLEAEHPTRNRNYR